MSNKTPNQKIIEGDILKYKLNKGASSLALLAIVFNALYFCMLYSFKTDYFKTWEIGISVIITLFSLLITFLSSEGIKNYNKKYCIILLVLAAVQIVRIFGLPLSAYRNDVAEMAAAEEAGTVANLALTGGYFFTTIMPKAAYTLLVIWLALSAVSLTGSAVIGYINCTRLEAHNKKVDSGEIDIDRTLIEMDREEERQACNIVSESDLTQNEIKLVEEDENA